MKKTLLIVLCIAVYSCSNGDSSHTTSYDLQVDKNVFLENNHCLKIVNKEYEICLTSISDSRCPSDAVCVWEGDAIAEFSFTSNGLSKSFELHTHKNFQQDTVVNGLKIKLLNVFPAPGLDDPIDQSDYSVELIVSNQEE